MHVLPSFHHFYCTGLILPIDLFILLRIVTPSYLCWEENQWFGAYRLTDKQQIDKRRDKVFLHLT